MGNISRLRIRAHNPLAIEMGLWYEGRMIFKTIAIGADHAGVDLKNALKNWLQGQGIRVLDMGTDGKDSVDYPDYAGKVARAIGDAKADGGILICGSGQGMIMAANRYTFIRAALVSDEEEAKLTRQHNNANIIAFGARRIQPEKAVAALKTFLSTAYEGGRHDNRVNKLTNLGGC